MPTSIADCPIETLWQIFAAFERETPWRIRSSTLSSCSRVCSYWKEPALSQLYSDVRVITAQDATRLAESALSRYHTDSLRFELTWKVSESDLDTLHTILRECEGVTKFAWTGYRFLVDLKVVVAVLSNPALSSVEKLILRINFDLLPPEDIVSTLAPLNIPFYLKSLATGGLNGAHKSFMKSFATASLAETSSSTLTSLDLALVLSSDRRCLEDLTIFNPIGPSLTSLSLPAIDSRVSMLDGSHTYFRAVVGLLALCTSLRYLSISGDEYSQTDSIIPTLERIFKSLKSTLKTFSFSTTFEILGVELWQVLEEAMHPGSVLAELEKLELPWTTLVEVQKVEGGVKFVDMLKEKGIKLVTQER